MAVGVFMEFPGVTREQYEQLVQGLGLSNYLERGKRCWRRYQSRMQATLTNPR